MNELKLAGNLDALEPISGFVGKVAGEAGLTEDAAYHLRLAADEIATNIVTHGYEEAGRSGNLELCARVSEEAVEIVIEDTGLPFDPRDASMPDESELSAPLEERRVGGLGVFLALKNLDDFRYEREGERNRCILIMHRSRTK